MLGNTVMRILKITVLTLILVFVSLEIPVVRGQDGVGITDVLETVTSVVIPGFGVASGIKNIAGASSAVEATAGKETCGVLSGSFTQCIIDATNWLVGKVALLLGSLTAFLISLAGAFIDVIINATKTITKSPLVQEGFKITLNIANLGFVLAIIIIAFATILRISGYGLKNILWKLVVAALLVNFSFAIAGVIIDFNNILGDYFLKAATPQKIKALSNSLAGLLNIQQLAGGTPTTAAQFGNALVSLAAIVIFNTLLVIVFFALAVMLLIRYVYLTILLIFMPLVWVFWIFPAMEGHWKKWWDKFFQWNFFYPGIAFFVYLSMVANEKFGELIKSGAGSEAGKSAAVIAGFPVASFLQILLVSGLLFGGLMAAQAFGIASTSSVLGMAKGVGRFATGAIGRGGRLAGRGFAGLAGRPIANKVLQKGGIVDRLADKLQGIPLLGRLTPGMKNLVASRESVVKSHDEKYKSYSKEAKLAEAQLFTTDKSKQTYFANELAKDGTLEKLRARDPKKFDQLMSSAKELGVTKDIISNAPEYAYDVQNKDDIYKKGVDKGIIKPGETVDDDTLKGVAIQMAMEDFKPSKVDELSAERIEKLAQYFGSNHLERLGKEGSISQIASAIRSGAKQGLKEGTDSALFKFATNNPTAQKFVKQNPEEFKAFFDVITKTEKEEVEKKSGKEKPSKPEVKKGPETSRPAGF